VPLPPLGQGYLWHVTGSAHGEDGFPTIKPDKVKALLDRLNTKVERHRKELIEYETYELDGAETLVISFASLATKLAQHLCAALPMEAKLITSVSAPSSSYVSYSMSSLRCLSTLVFNLSSNALLCLAL